MKVNDLRRELNDYYESEIKHCCYHDQCEFGCKKQFSNVEKLGEPVGAFIGENYDKHRILFVGINTNEAEGIKSIYKDQDYSKGLEWTYHEIDQLLKVHFGFEESNIRNVAFTNLIHCSWIPAKGTKGKRSEPVWIQWVNCIHRQKVVETEIDKIQPQLIFAVGDSVYDELQIKYYETKRDLIPHYLFTVNNNRNTYAIARLPHLFNQIWPRRWMKEFKNGKFPKTYKPIFEYLGIYQEGNEKYMIESMRRKLEEAKLKREDFGRNNDLIQLTVFAQLHKLKAEGIITI